LFFLTAAAAVLLFISCDQKQENKESNKVTYTLTVTRGQGVDGNPNSGGYTYDSGMTANYSYRALEDYYGLTVTLDGSPVEAAGTVTMNANHLLVATCLQRVLWKYTFAPLVYHSSPAVGDDGTIYIGSGMYAGDKGILYAIGADGALKWSYQGQSCLYSPVIGKEGSIFVQDFYNTVYAVASDGTQKWVYHDYPVFYPTNVGQRNPAVGADGTVYIAADGLHAVNPATGQRIWHFVHPVYPYRHCYASPVIGQDGTIYVVIEDTLFAVKPSGSRRWSFTVPHDWEMSFTSPAIDQNGVIYVGYEGKLDGADYSRVYAVNPNGTFRWQYAVEDGRYVRASPAVGPDGRIYVATKSNTENFPAKLIALSPGGQKVWDYVVERVHVTPDDTYSSPAVGADGLIYFGAETGYVYALNQDGTLNWKFQLQHGIN
jgi:outer membrane protein assembly factor BamB